MKLIELGGSQGEGGGQILRSALALSMITGTPFRITQIRAKRSKPGLLRQHLTAVNAAVAICGAQVTGNAAGSQTLEFSPDAIKGGAYRFDIGTAGSCTLVLQTVLPALWFADAASTVTVSGGTHNSAAPPADFLIRAWLPLMRRMGIQTDIELLRHGFYPAGGGEVRAAVTPVKSLQAIELCSRGELLSAKNIAVIAGLPAEIAQRELQTMNLHLAEATAEMRVLPSREGPGNAVMVELRHEHLTEVFTVFGEKGTKAEAVAQKATTEARRYLHSNAAVGEHLADQLLLPMALAGAGRFTAVSASSHLETNVQVIQRFLDVGIEVLQEGTGSEVRVGW